MRSFIYLIVILGLCACDPSSNRIVAGSNQKVGINKKDEVSNRISLDTTKKSLKEIYSSTVFGLDSLVVMDWEWKELGPTNFPKGSNPRTIGVGRINTLYPDPVNKNRIFACSSAGGLFFSNDNGESWQNGGTDFLPTIGVADVIVNPGNPKNWLIATGDGETDFSISKGVFLTLDEGRSWKEINTGLPFNRHKNNLVISKIIANPKNFQEVFIACNKGLFKCNNILSSNPGWDLVVGKANFYDIEFKPDDSNFVVASGDEIYISVDGGKKWAVMNNTEFTNIEYHHRRTSVIFSNLAPYYLYAAVTGRAKNKKYFKAELHQYSFISKSWESKGQIRDISYLHNGMDMGRAKSIAIFPSNSEEVWVGNVNPIQRSLDGGKNWKSVMTGLHDDIRDLKFTKDGNKLWVATDGGVYLSMDTGRTWIPKSKGLGVSTVHAVSSSQTETTRIIIGCYDTGSSVMNEDEEWTFLTGGDGYGNAIDPINPDIVYSSVVGGSVYKNYLDSTGWRRNYVGAPNNGSDWQTWIDISPVNHKILYQCGKSLWRSTNMGERNSWTGILDIKDIDSSSGATLRVYPSPNDPNSVYGLLLGKKPFGLVRSFNANDSVVKWELIKGYNTSWVGGVAISYGNPKNFWITYTRAKEGFNEKVLAFTNGNWQNITYDLPDLISVKSVIATENDDLYIGTSAGVYFKRKNGKNWILLKGVPNCNVSDMEINRKQRKIIVGTFGRGVWEANLVK